MTKPLSIILGILIFKEKLLLIRRAKGEFQNLLGLLGGKIELNEHIGAAAERQILEESGIVAHFQTHLGVISEHIVENQVVTKHLILHICELQTDFPTIFNGQEGAVNWYDLTDLTALKAEIIPSDFLIIEKFVLKKECGYYESVIEQENERYNLLSFR